MAAGLFFWAFILHVTLHVVVGRGRELNRAVAALAVVSVALLVLGQLS